MRSVLIAVVFALLSFSASAQAAHKPMKNEYRATYSVKAEFGEVREQIKAAIANKGLKINNISYIGNMLKRTGKDLGYKKVVYKDAQAFEFCSATVSRFMMEADPHHIVFCPYVISVYELADKPGTVYVSYRRPSLVGDAKSRKTLQDVEKLLDSIIQDALSWF
jgi:uncharacterized protein (DUF302 family)